MSLSHGSNDSQKTMGIIVSLLVAEQSVLKDFPIRAFHVTSADSVPVWVIFAAYLAIALGTMAGGWRIVKTMGQRLTKLKPFGGGCADAGEVRHRDFTLPLAPGEPNRGQIAQLRVDLIARDRARCHRVPQVAVALGLAHPIRDELVRPREERGLELDLVRASRS